MITGAVLMAWDDVLKTEISDVAGPRSSNVGSKLVLSRPGLVTWVESEDTENDVSIFSLELMREQVYTCTIFVI